MVDARWPRLWPHHVCTINGGLINSCSKTKPESIALGLSLPRLASDSLRWGILSRHPGLWRSPRRSIGKATGSQQPTIREPKAPRSPRLGFRYDSSINQLPSRIASIMIVV